MPHTARRRLLSLLPLLAPLALAAPAAAQPALGAPTVELITMGPGDEAFELFGHAALCVTSAVYPEGICYNYGTTDFSDPASVTWHVIQGDAIFWVETVSKPWMLKSYTRADRTVYSQRLPLTSAQAWRLARALEHEALPENKYFVYNHFFNNCTNPVRDHIDAATDGALRDDTPSGSSFRDLIRPGFAAAPPLLWLSELALGRSIDAEASVWEAMFLPVVLRQQVQQRLGAEPEVLYVQRGPERPQDPTAPLTTWRVALVLLGALFGALNAFSHLRDRRLPTLPGALVLGLAGLVVWGLAIVSPTVELRANATLLLLVPLDLALPFLPRAGRAAYATARAATALAVALLALTGVLVQPLLPAAALALLAMLPPALLARRRQPRP